MIAITYNREGFVAEFQAKIKVAKNPRGMLKAAGREVNSQLRTHFRAKDQTGANQISDRRSHFWNAVARSVQNPVMEDANTVSVSINDPRFAQRLFGGTIRAKLASALTIPVEERAYDRTARTFEAETGLKLFLVRNGSGAFGTAVLAVAEGKGLTVEYVLTPSVTQQPDPTALPAQSLLEAAILTRAQAVLDTEIERAGSAGSDPSPV